MNKTKAYIWKYKDLTVQTELVKNEHWRWYSTAYKYHASKGEPERTFVRSSASNARFADGAIREFIKEAEQLRHDEVANCKHVMSTAGGYDDTSCEVCGAHISEVNV